MNVEITDLYRVCSFHKFTKEKLVLRWIRDNGELSFDRESFGMEFKSIDEIKEYFLKNNGNLRGGGRFIIEKFQQIKFIEDE